MKKSANMLDRDDANYLGRAALTGLATGAVGGGSLGLMYLLLKSYREKLEAGKRKEEIKYLSPYAPTAPNALPVGLNKASADRSWLEELGRGAVMIPATAAATLIPAWMAFKYLGDKRQEAETSRLDRELDGAREDFNEALREGTDIADQIDDHLEKKSFGPNTSSGGTGETFDVTSAVSREEAPGLVGSIPGWAGGALAGVGGLTAVLAFIALNNSLAKNNKNVAAIQALTELQRRRRALGETTPEVGVKVDDSGQMYVS